MGHSHHRRVAEKLVVVAGLLALAIVWIQVLASGVSLTAGEAVLLVSISIASAGVGYSTFNSSSKTPDTDRLDSLDAKRRQVLNHLDRSGIGVGRQLVRNWPATVGALVFIAALLLGLLFLDAPASGIWTVENVLFLGCAGAALVSGVAWALWRRPK